MSELTLSILIPNYNDGELLERKLNELLPVLPKECEVLICDDASTDQSVRRLQPLVEACRQCTLICNDRNLGVMATVNRLYPLARGRYLYFCSANDRLEVTGLLSLIEEASSSTHAVITTDPLFMREGQEPYCERLLHDCLHKREFSADEVVKLFASTNFWVTAHGSFFRRDLIARYGGYRESLGTHSDFFLNHLIAFDSGLCYLPCSPIACLDSREGSYSSSLDIGEKRAEIEGLFRALCDLPPKLKSRYLRSGILAPIVKQIYPKALFNRRYWTSLLFIALRKYRIASYRYLARRRPLFKEVD